jgi:hypothetical protein
MWVGNVSVASGCGNSKVRARDVGSDASLGSKDMLAGVNNRISQGRIR